MQNENNPKIVFFDCDGTLTKGTHGGRLFEYLDINTLELQNLWQKYYVKKLTLKELNSYILELIKGKKAKKEEIEKILGNFEFNDGVLDLINFLNIKGIECVIISSGIDYFVESVAKALNISTFRYNSKYHYSKNGYLKKIFNFDDEDISKVSQIIKICKLYSISPQNTFYIGDSVNDILAFQLTEHGFIYRNKALNDRAWKSIENISEIKFYIN